MSTVSNYILDFFYQNFLQLVIIIALLFLNAQEKNFSLPERCHLVFLLVLVFILTVCDYVDHTIGDFSAFTDGTAAPNYLIRRVCAAVGYAFRPVLSLFSFMLLFQPKKKIVLPMCIPSFLNMILSFVSIETGWVFYITEANTWSMGPAYYFYIVCAMFYLALNTVLLFVKWKKFSGTERIATTFVIVAITGCSLIDMFTDTRVYLLIPSIAASFMMYYLFLYAQKSNQIIKLQQAEMQAKTNALLLSQIQPHFIYNTLNVIYALCYTDPELAGKTILNFSDYLRSNLDHGNINDFTTVEDEIKHTQLYTELEKLRFPQLTILYDIRDGGYSLPCLSVQPMVENAVRHGVRGLPNGTVNVSFFLENGNHVIKIADNGTGKSQSNTALGDHKGIGIPNVRSRIEQMCHGTFDIVMSETGTTVTITVPVTNTRTL